MGLEDSFIRVWGRGEPNDINRGESCVYLYTRKGYNFNDATCNANENFICERPNSEFIIMSCCLMSLDMVKIWFLALPFTLTCLKLVQVSLLTCTI